MPTQAKANTRPNHPVKKMRTNQEIDVVTLDTDTSEDETVELPSASSSSSSSSSEDEVQVIGTRKVARIINSTRNVLRKSSDNSGPSYSRFTSRRFETKNSSDHFTRNFLRGRDVTNSLNRNFGKSFGTKNTSDHITRNSFRGRDVTNFSGGNHNAKATGGSRQLDL